MEEFLNKEQAEDELVRIEAESLELMILVSSWSGGLEMPKDVVPLSEAIKTMDEFSKEVSEHWDLDGERVYYRVYACKDEFHLFSYCGGEICSDHRKDERPKNPERVYFRLMNGGTTPPQVVCTDAMEYAEWAERKLAERWTYVMERSDPYRTWDRESKRWVDVHPENLFFDVYGDKEGRDYRYSYKDGKTFIRPLTQREQRKKQRWEKSKTYDSLPFMKKA